MPSQPTPQDWSQRRSEDSIEDPRFSREELLQRQLLTFGGGTFRDQVMIGTEWRVGTDLSGIKFLDCTLTGADFSHCDLRNCSFVGSRFVIANFLCANAEGADFSKVIGPASEFMAANLRNARFVDASIVSSDFRGADLRGADLSGAVLSESRFCAANLEGAILTNAILDGADFTGATMPDGTLYRDPKAEPVVLPVAKVEKDAA
jgi:uncharacterized protein YjbI with pentapeptide repeats